MLKDPNFVTFLSRLVYVPKCAACGERLSPLSKSDNLSYGRVCLCDKCMEQWQTAKREMCHTCYMPAGECTCTSLTRKIKQPFIPSLFFYHQNRTKVQNRVLFTAKRKSSPDLFEFLAKELAPSVSRLIESQGSSIDECIMTWIPRKPKSVKKYRHDQAKLLCLTLAEEIGCGVALPLFIRKGGKEQKKLDESARNKNLVQSVFLNEDLKNIRKRDAEGSVLKLCNIVEAKTVIVVDDIITTGASMRRAILLLEPLRPKKVLCVCIARSEISSKNKKQ